MVKSKTQSKPFKFKQFEIAQDKCTMKVGTDGILLGAWANVEGASEILDIGAGTGLIALMLAQRAASATITGVEIEEHACSQASENAANSPWADRIKIEKDSIQDFAKFPPNEYDLVVSNPPFFSGGTFSDNQERNNVRHTIKLPTGDLLSAARKVMSKNGKFCVILPYLEGLRLVDQASNYRLYCTKMTEVFGKKSKPVERLLLQFETSEKELEKDSIVVYQEDGKYTADYVGLTKDFYLKM